MAPPADYVIGPGDEIAIRAWGSIELDHRAVVDRNGQISVPRVGTFGVARLKAGELEAHIRTRFDSVFKGFSLNVSLGQLRGIRLFAVGQARRPGSYTVPALSTLIGAVFATGGPAPSGSLRKVQLKRGNAVAAEVDLYDFIVKGERAADIPLQNGDVLVYFPVGPRVALLGATDNSAIYELKSQQESLRDVLEVSGGTRATTTLTRAQLERLDPQSATASRVVQALDLKAPERVALRDGDMITLFNVEPQFANAVTLRGNVARPLRYPFVPGMRLSDLIPERDALITPDYHIRKNRMVQFVDGAEPAGSPRNIVDEPNWNYATVERLNADRITFTLIPVNLAKAVLERDPEHNLPLRSGDVVTVFSGRDIQIPQARRTRLVRVEGEVERPGVYQLQANESLRDIIRAAGGITSQAYLYGTEFLRESTRRQQRLALDDAIRRLEASLATSSSRQLANSSTDAATAARLQAAEDAARQGQLARLRALEPNGRIALELPPAIRNVDTLPELALEDGDRVVIPARSGFVFAVGAVSNENALLWREGRTVRSYLGIAGVTADADESNAFVLRADGSVVRNESVGLIGGGNRFQSLELFPGDTVVVPDRLNRETAWGAFVRNAKDWSQILSNFGLAAAAIKTLSN